MILRDQHPVFQNLQYVLVYLVAAPDPDDEQVDPEVDYEHEQKPRVVGLGKHNSRSLCLFRTARDKQKSCFRLGKRDYAHVVGVEGPG